MTDYESDYLALLINKPELIEVSQMKARFFDNPDNQNMFNIITNCYKKYKTLSVPKMLEENKKFNIDYYTVLLTDTLLSESNWKEQMELAEENILRKFKERYIKKRFYY